MNSKKPSPEEARASIAEAMREVTAAEEELSGLLASLSTSSPRAERADKVVVTQVVETAFRRLRAAREELVKAQAIVEAAASA